MNHRWVDYSYIGATIAFSVAGQMLLKWRMDHFGALPAGWAGGLRHLLGLLLDPVVVLSFVTAFLASLAWMAAMTRFELSHAYPFTSLNFVVVLALSSWLLGESLTPSKLGGVALIVAGTVLASARTP